MRRGYFKMWRKSKESAVFAHEGIWKLWCLCLIKATRKEIEITIPGILKPVKLEPGQFIGGREALHYEYHQGDLRKKYSRKLKPTAITLYRWLLVLQNMQMLHIKTCKKYSIITVLNWSLYQENEQQVNNRRTTDEHKQEVKKERNKETPSFFSLRSRYPDQDLLDQVFEAIASTRKSNKVAESVLIAQLQKWERYPVEQVQAGIRTYLQKDFAGQGKGEAYLLGVIRNQKIGEPRQESTGSPLLDAYYARNSD